MTDTLAQHVSFFGDVATVARRALRSLLREPEAVIPALLIPVFFFIVNTGSLEDFVEQIPGIDYKAFQLPVGIIFA
ncbi:MAG: ABC-2 type transport system permease protein, partial [Candidatus Poriferisodalaceae bacterium]